MAATAIGPNTTFSGLASDRTATLATQAAIGDFFFEEDTGLLYRRTTAVGWALTAGKVSTTHTPVGAVAPTNSTSTVLETNRVAKAAPGILWGASGFNNKTSGQYVQIHDAAALPADASVPVLTQWVPAQSPFSFDFGSYGRNFATGIVFCNSSTLATKTIGSADCWFDVQLT